MSTTKHRRPNRVGEWVRTNSLPLFIVVLLLQTVVVGVMVNRTDTTLADNIDDGCKRTDAIAALSVAIDLTGAGVEDVARSAVQGASLDVDGNLVTDPPERIELLDEATIARVETFLAAIDNLHRQVDEQLDVVASKIAEARPSSCGPSAATRTDPAIGEAPPPRPSS